LGGTGVAKSGQAALSAHRFGTKLPATEFKLRILDLARVSAVLIACSLTAAAPASAGCRIYGVEGYTGGPSVIRMVTPRGTPCTIRHYTHFVGERQARVVETRRFKVVERPRSGKLRFAGNRASFRGKSASAFQYRFADRGGYVHDVRVHVIAR
jgi:hypothetical protein